MLFPIARRKVPTGLSEADDISATINVLMGRLEIAVSLLKRLFSIIVEKLTWPCVLE